MNDSRWRLDSLITETEALAMNQCQWSVVSTCVRLLASHAPRSHVFNIKHNEVYVFQCCLCSPDRFVLCEALKEGTAWIHLVEVTVIFVHSDDVRMDQLFPRVVGFWKVIRSLCNLHFKIRPYCVRELPWKEWNLSYSWLVRAVWNSVASPRLLTTTLPVLNLAQWTTWCFNLFLLRLQPCKRSNQARV